MISGVDVSSYQPSTYNTSGLSFSIVKATESTSYVNPEHDAQVACARNAGLVVGHYHYATGTDSTAQVAYFAAHANVQPGDLVMLDWEENSVTPAARDEWLASAKATFPGNKVLLYCDVSRWNSLDPTHSCGDGLVIADYNGGSAPDITQPWVFWQYSSSGGIDHDYGNFASEAALRSWAGGITPPAPSTYQYRATHNKLTPVVVDGGFGFHTIEALQYVVGTVVDGSWGTDSIKHLQAMLGVAQDGQQGPITVKALQRAVGVAQDGNWGPITTRAVQTALNKGTLY